MSKPDWKDAPEWAQWLAMDRDGTWVWFEHAPFPDLNQWCEGMDSPEGTRFEVAASPAPVKDWHESVEPRP